MKKFFAPNIIRAGRIARLIYGVIMLVACVIAFPKLWWLGVFFLASALFAFFEAARGWCVLRACGIKTKL
jgi:hypothetical protein